MNIKGLGDLIPDSDIEEWLVSTPVPIPYIGDVSLQFIVEDVEEDPNKDEYVTAIQNFLSLQFEDRCKANEYIFQNYQRFCELVDEDDVWVQITNAQDVWEHIQVTEVHVSRRYYGDKKVYVQLIAECDWEIEHGLQLVFRNGNELNRVSEQDGHLTHCDAYALPEAEDRIC
ncbi:DUF6985 domain-containing protein [Vibrio vulnificus]|uniref:DUF6985 domain-containing protein n=1 Tax=Vibrio vulnificus TaxID=672 RepID=UPI001CDCD012|nr:hypothetical protein [Vibrio vulnificus]MCA4021096.1 hypothetical protein [Vibrio vulnificus]